MKIGITGSTGVLGKILCEKLQILGMDFAIFRGDIRKKSDIKTWLKENKFDSIIHLAAIVPTAQVSQNPLLAYEVNVGGTINLLSELKESGQTPWVFYASSSHVYKSKNIPISEEDEINPISQYGWTKYMGEKICTDFSKSENCSFPICCGRIFSLYHKTQTENSIYGKMLKRFENEDLSKPFFIYNSKGVRDFLNMEIAVDIIIKLMLKKSSGIFNIASGKGILIEDFVQSICNKKLDIVSDDGENDILVADTTKLKKEINYDEK